VETVRRSNGAGRSSQGARENPSPKRRGIAGVIFGFSILVAALGGLILLIAQEPQPAATFFSSGRISLQFGLTREAITRFSRFDLCPAETASQGRFSECANREELNATRPAIVAVGLESDLTDAEAQKQFPVGQVTVSATNVGRAGILVSMTANPAEPTRVLDGEYNGRVIIDRSDGSQIVTDVFVSLTPRTGIVTAKVLVALILGALGGAVIKWLDDSFGPVAALRRRQRRVENYLRLRSPVASLSRKAANPPLPEGVLRRLEDVRLAIRTFDADGVADTLGLISRNQDALVEFANGLEALDGEIATQKRLLERVSSTVAAGAIAMEAAKLKELRSRIWPWEKAGEVTEELRQAQRDFQELTMAMRRAQYDARYTEVMNDLASKRITGGPDDPMSKLLAVTTPTESKSTAEESSTIEHETAVVIDSLPADTESDEQPQGYIPEGRRSPGLWLLDNAWWLTLAAIAALVVFVGYQTQFLDDFAFQGDRRDYIQLAAWALAVQVAGGTIIDTAGKLRASRVPA
jgi:hypothetical protein